MVLIQKNVKLIFLIFIQAESVLSVSPKISSSLFLGAYEVSLFYSNFLKCFRVLNDLFFPRFFLQKKLSSVRQFLRLWENPFSSNSSLCLLHYFPHDTPMSFLLPKNFLVILDLEVLCLALFSNFEKLVRVFCFSPTRLILS